MRCSIVALLALTSLAAAQAHGETGAQTMGPAAFLWPPDREWSDDWDNTSPCGSATSARNRTQFPLENGAVALVMQDDAWDVEVSIYYGNDEPVSLSQFMEILPEIDGLEAGHMCYSVPDQPTSVTAGSNATLELRYVAEDDGSNSTLYVCADVTFVSASSFNQSVIPCFNVTYSSYASLNASSSGSDYEAVATSTASSIEATTSAEASTSSSAISTSLAGAAILNSASFGRILPVVGFIGALFV